MAALMKFLLVPGLIHIRDIVEHAETTMARGTESPSALQFGNREYETPPLATKPLNLK